MTGCTVAVGGETPGAYADSLHPLPVFRATEDLLTGRCQED